MSTRLNPDAAFDCLVLGRRLQAASGTFTHAELHLFAYLSCILWLYRERPAADWGYSFVGTELGAPYSVDVDAAISSLMRRGYILEVDGRLQVTEESLAFVSEFNQLDLNADRMECLAATCASASALSIGMVGDALSREPELRRARGLAVNRPLLEEMALSRLHEQFDVLRRELPSATHDLRVPAIVWLTALCATAETHLA